MPFEVPLRMGGGKKVCGSLAATCTASPLLFEMPREKYLHLVPPAPAEGLGPVLDANERNFVSSLKLSQL
jgi:hypothetical protein